MQTRKSSQEETQTVIESYHNKGVDSSQADKEIEEKKKDQRPKELHQ